MGFGHYQEPDAKTRKLINELIRPPRPEPHWSEALDVIESRLRRGERAERELGEIRATVLVNFGPNGRLKSIHSSGDGEGRSTMELVFYALEKLIQFYLADGEHSVSLQANSDMS